MYSNQITSFFVTVALTLGCALTSAETLQKLNAERLRNDAESRAFGQGGPASLYQALTGNPELAFTTRKSPRRREP
jgi:hypothetical protein